MKQKFLVLSRVPMAFAAVAAIMVLAGCPQATKTSKDLGFGIEGLMVAVVPPLTVGTPMADVTLPEAKGSSGTLTYRMAPTVPGLSFDPATRVLSGTPIVAGTYPLTYTATTSGGAKASLNFTVEVVSSLAGTWRATYEWYENDRVVGTYTDTLTFTKSRYILQRSHYMTGNTSLYDDWTRSGGWKSTESTVTRIWMHDHDDNNDTPDVLTRVPKNYLWNEGRTTLCMQHWADDQERVDQPKCDSYERVTSPPPTALRGKWIGIGDDDNRSIVLTPTLFTFVIEQSEDDVFTLTGTYAVNQEELFIRVTVEDVLENGESTIDTDEHWWKGQVSRWAFAPTDSPTGMVVSPHWGEQAWIDQEWVDNPYGNYRLRMEKE